MVDQNRPISVHVYVTVYTIGLLSADSAGKFTANCCSTVQTAVATISSYKPLSGLNLLGIQNGMAATCPLLL